MLEITLLYWPPESDLAAVYAARAGAIQEVGSSPTEALDALAVTLSRRFPRPSPPGDLFAQEGA
jgi:hypothetical protein